MPRCYKQRALLNPATKRGKLIKAFLGLGLALTLSFGAKPTPHLAFSQSQHIKKNQVQQAVKPTEPTPQPLVQPEQPAVVEAPQPIYVPPPAPVVGCGSDPNMAYIYSHESGCRTDAVNSIGCLGLGQACPGSKLPCSTSDWDCQNNYFTAYALSRYGSTYNAYSFWVANHWW